MKHTLLLPLLLSLSVAGILRGQDPVPSVPQVVPIVGHATGAGGAEFRSDLKLYNPSPVAISGLLFFTPRNQSAAQEDEFLLFDIPPLSVLAYEDVYAQVFPGGNGAARVTVFVNGPRPMVDTSTYTATPDGGELGQSPTVFTYDDFFAAGTRLGAILGKDTERTNLFVMTGDAGATIRWRYRDSNGSAIPNIVRTYPPNATFQFSVFDLLGFPPAANASLEAIVDAGSARVACSPVNNITNQGRWSDFRVLPSR